VHAHKRERERESLSHDSHKKGERGIETPEYPAKPIRTCVGAPIFSICPRHFGTNRIEFFSPSLLGKVLPTWWGTDDICTLLARVPTTSVPFFGGEVQVPSVLPILGNTSVLGTYLFGGVTEGSSGGPLGTTPRSEDTAVINAFIISARLEDPSVTLPKGGKVPRGSKHPWTYILGVFW